VLEHLAVSKDVGVYAELAQEKLAISRDDSRWQHSAALLFARYFGRGDELSISGTKRLGKMKGVGWLRWVPLNWLREKGHVTDAFLQEWTTLVPAAGIAQGERPAAQWRCASEAPPENWTTLDFDDSGWTQTNGPLANAAYHFIRIPFEASASDLGTWRLYVKNDGRDARAAVYLNGICISWIDPWRDEYLTVDLVPAARRHLKKGRNVLAVRLSNPHKFDIGLYAEPKEGGGGE
jgi:hypothetical protein